MNSRMTLINKAQLIRQLSAYPYQCCHAYSPMKDRILVSLWYTVDSAMSGLANVHHQIYDIRRTVRPTHLTSPVQSFKKLSAVLGTRTWSASPLHKSTLTSSTTHFGTMSSNNSILILANLFS